MESGFVARIIDKLKKFINSSLFLSPYVKNYILLSNARSGIFMAAIIAALELWMITSAIINLATSTDAYSFSWLCTHLVAYILLLANAVFLFWFCIHFLRGDEINSRIGKIIKFVFVVISIGFGIFISYTSVDIRGQVFAFVTMALFSICVFVWHPIACSFILTLSFFLYMYFQGKISPITYSIKVNSFTAWIAMMMICLNNRHQRRIEAQKDENLEKLNAYLEHKAQTDDLTGIPNMISFRAQAIDVFQNPETDASKLCFVFTNIENFANYNETYGFSAGNVFLKKVAKIIKTVFEGDIVARFSDDHFVILCRRIGFEEKIKSVNTQIAHEETFVKLIFKAGFYVPKDNFASPINACDRARYACMSLKKYYGRDIAEYDDKLATQAQQNQYIINNIDSAMQNKYIKVFYQPVVWAENGKICGVEALARWESPEYGLLQPMSFIPVLEEYHLIHKLDLYVMETVCKEIHEAYVKKLPLIPVSINFSRLDFELIDPVLELNRCIETYGISRKDIHVEITESSITDSKLVEVMNNFRNSGFSLWLDDFGSGYSSLNVLKDFNFDMMKIDKGFLSEFSENSKNRPIITSIISLANKIGMQTLTEGVETTDMRDFLTSIGCQRLQGYLFGKPMPKEELIKKIKDGTYDTSMLPIAN